VHSGRARGDSGVGIATSYRAGAASSGAIVVLALFAMFVAAPATWARAHGEPPAGSATRTPTATPARAATERAVTSSRTPAHPSAPLSIAAPGSTLTLDPLAGPIVVGATLNLTGAGFTPGSVLVLFVSGGAGVQTFGPLTPSASTATTLAVPIPASIPLGLGFATVQVVNPDQNFIQSNVQAQYLFGAAASNLPTIMAVNGVGLGPPDTSVPLNSVATVIVQGSTVTITGTGFNAPHVALFSGNPNAADLTPLPGGSATQIQVVVPMNIPTGPGSLQVINAPLTGNVVSNTVSVPIGEQLRIDSVSQTGNTITVTGAGFSALTVISFFNLQGGTVVNLGGLEGTRSLIQPTVVSSQMLTFPVPPGALSGPAYVQVLNAPFIPFTSSGSTPNGALTVVVPMAARGAGSLRFFGNGTNDIDRVKILLDNPPRPVDVGGDFTLEFWMKTAAGNGSGACAAGDDNWMNGNVIFDRDVFGGGDFGAYGISLFGSGGQLAFGVNRLGTGTTICGTANVADGAWHHVAATRSSGSGQLRIFVDGALDASGTGPTGDVSYRDGRATTHPNSDPFLVIGAEKFDLGPGFPSFHGWIDEVRISTVVRYGAAFSPPTAPFATDTTTAALYHFDEGNGNAIVDDAHALGGPSTGVRRLGGSPAGPQWSPDTPFPTATPAIALDNLPFMVNAPTSITNCGDNRLFITEQGGTIRIWDGTQLLPTPFLTVSPIAVGGEQGLLSIVFHPQYAQNGYFYVYSNPTTTSTSVARYKVSSDPNVADPNSRLVLLTVPQPATNHNGGELQFGADGYLYIGKGDGGGACDSAGAGCNAQRDNLLLGKLLRIDVDHTGNGTLYAIPPTNPFAGPGGPLGEIWAKGLRNPWRFTFDRLTKSLFIGDVGQSTREEVDVRPSDDPGGENYGWNRMEGFDCNTCDVSSCPVPPPPCDDPSYTLPVLDYDHSFGCAIIGGYVYRGTQVPFLYGKYLFGDLCSGRLWWARDNEGTWSNTQFVPTDPNLTSFGEDAYGEVYLASGSGTVAKIVPAP
jgi:glucose/arabinose dehydrogenase